jgi:peptide/nickel transport system substrate-binding protein
MTDEQYRREYGQHLVDMVKRGQMTRRQLLVRASVFGFSATVAGQLLAACGSSTSSSGGGSATPAPSGTGAPAPVRGGTLSVVINPSITDLDPVTIYDTGGVALIQQFCQYLINVNDDLSLKPVLAESWSPNQTGDVWTFKLRQGVKFNDGSPFEADDVVTTMERLVDPKSGSAAQVALKGILSPGGTKKVDQYTVDFNLDKPFADFPYLVCQSSYNTVMLPRNYQAPWIKNPVGTGPWLLKSYTAKQHCTAVPNPTYWGTDASGGKLPYLDQVEWVMVNDEAAQVVQIQSGAVDVQMETVYQGAQALFADPNLKVLVFPSSGIRELFVATNQAPWTDVKVRQALAYTLDRTAINEALFASKSTVAYDSFYQTPPYPNEPPTLQFSPDIAKAKQLLSDAGHANGITVTLTCMKYLEAPQYAQLVKAQAAPAGININIQLIDYNKWYAGSNSNTPWLNSNMGIVEWLPRPTPAVYTQAMLLPDSVWSSCHWNDPQFASTFDKYMATVDESSRMSLATELSQMQHDNVPIILSFFISDLRAMKKNVYGVVGPGATYIDLSAAYKA